MGTTLRRLFAAAALLLLAVPAAAEGIGAPSDEAVWLFKELDCAQQLYNPDTGRLGERFGCGGRDWNPMVWITAVPGAPNYVREIRLTTVQWQGVKEDKVGEAWAGALLNRYSRSLSHEPFKAFLSEKDLAKSFTGAVRLEVQVKVLPPGTERTLIVRPLWEK